LQADGATRVQFLGGDGDLPSQPKLGTVGEARAGVDVDGGGIDFVDEALGVGGVVGEDAIRVLGGVQVDVVDSLVEVIHYAHTQYQTEPFLVEVAICGGEDTTLGIAGEDLQGVVIATQLDVIGLEVGGEFGEEVGGDSAMHEEGIESVANGGTLDFGVLDDGEGFFLVGALIDEEVTDSDATGHDGHGGVGFAEVLQGVATARDEEVNVLVEAHELIDKLAVGVVYKLDSLGGDVGDHEGSVDKGEEGAVGGEGFFATTQDDGVAGFDGEGADIDGDIRTGFVDDGHDAEGDGDAFGVDAAGEGFFFELVADGIGHCEEGLQVSGDGVQAWLGEQEAIEKGIAKPGSFGVGDVAGVGGKNVATLIPQALGEVVEKVIFLLGGDLGELAGGLAGSFCDLGQVGHLGTSLKEEQVVVMDNFVSVIIAEGVFDLLGLESDDFGEVFVAVVDEAEGEFFVVFIFEADDIATCKCPTSVLDADGEQASAIP